MIRGFETESVGSIPAKDKKKKMKENEIEKAEQRNPAIMEVLEFYRQWRKKYPYTISFEIGNVGDAELEDFAVIMDSDEVMEAKARRLMYIREYLHTGDSIELNKFK